MDQPLYIVAVNGICEKFGPSHRVIAIGDGARPVIACGGDVGALNWTGHYTPPTYLCKRCGQWEAKQ
jgi:hypothetical protein